jgi:hypothetical protein
VLHHHAKQVKSHVSKKADKLRPAHTTQEGATKVPVHPWSPRSPNRRDSCATISTAFALSSAMINIPPAMIPQPGRIIRPAETIVGRAPRG